MAYVARPDGTTKTVKNLGWLIANKDEVEYIACERFADGSGYLTAQLSGSRVFHTPFGSWSVMQDFLSRSRTFPLVTTRRFGVNPEGIRFDETKPGWTLITA